MYKQVWKNLENKVVFLMENHSQISVQTLYSVFVVILSITIHYSDLQLCKIDEFIMCYEV